ncbi:MAG: hypothetical protein ACXAB7_05790 [Candidatus Kariarchaeaceae archaeon]
MERLRGRILTHMLRKLAFIFILFSIMSASSTWAFVPVNESVFVNTLSSVQTDIPIGTFADITVTIKNLTNDTISNVTLFQAIPAGIDFISSDSMPDAPYSEDVSYEDISVINQITKQNRVVNWLNVTARNFTMNFDQMPVQDAFSFQFTINSSIVSASLVIVGARVTYYDFWGDRQQAISDNTLTYQVTEVPTNEKAKFFPDVTVDEIDYWKVAYVIVISLFVALISRMLYKKRPIEL